MSRTPSSDSLDFGDAMARNSEQLRDRQQDLLHKPFSRIDLDVFENEQVRPIYLSSDICAYISASPQSAYA